MEKATTTYVTVVDPRIKTESHRTGTVHDYVRVPRLATHGSFPLMQLLSDQSMLNVLKVYKGFKRNGR